MQVTIKYFDNESFTKEEIVRNAIHHFGRGAEVTVMPDSTNAHDFLYFGIQQIITHEQLGLFFNNRDTYSQDISKLRKDTLEKLAEILDTVIIENEAKVG